MIVTNIVFRRIYVTAAFETAEFRIPAGAGNVSLRHRVQTGSGAHPVFYLMDTWG